MSRVVRRRREAPDRDASEIDRARWQAQMLRAVTSLTSSARSVADDLARVASDRLYDMEKEAKIDAARQLLEVTLRACDLDAAEDYFLKSLEIMHAEVGQKHEETASVSNNLGAVYLAAGYLDQAREMHMIALETRREIFGENHPDTAQSHNNLALALLQTGDRAWARRHFEKALAGFEALGAAYSDDLEAVASNYCDFLKEEGEANLAEIIAGRVRELLAGV